VGDGQPDTSAGPWVLHPGRDEPAGEPAAPEVYDQGLRLPPGSRAAEIAFLAALVGFIALLGVGVVRRWRWTIWLILVAFLAGVLRVPLAILQLIGALADPSPTWYVVLQGLLGVVQFAIGLVMVAGYRCAGVWRTA
jgi:hypothetical protein